MISKNHTEENLLWQLLLDIKQVRLNVLKLSNNGKEKISSKEILNHLECLLPPEYNYMVGEQWIDSFPVWVKRCYIPSLFNTYQKSGMEKIDKKHGQRNAYIESYIMAYTKILETILFDDSKKFYEYDAYLRYMENCELEIIKKYRIRSVDNIFYKLFCGTEFTQTYTYLKACQLAKSCQEIIKNYSNIAKDITKTNKSKTVNKNVDPLL